MRIAAPRSAAALGSDVAGDVRRRVLGPDGRAALAPVKDTPVICGVEVIAEK